MIKIFLKIFCKLACFQNIFKRKYILLVDNIFNNDAELVDNFALFEYLQAQDEYKDISFYIINKKNIKYKEIKKKYKNIIPIKNNKMNLLLALKLFKAKYWLDSFQVINRFKINIKKYFQNSKIIPVYMQHGINYFKYGFYVKLGAKVIGDTVFKKIVFANENERNFFKEFYGYDDRNTILAGLSRWDKISDADNKNRTIFVYFTHRLYLRNKELPIENTNYYKNIIAFLHSERLSALLNQYNVKLKIGLHHEILRFCDFKITNIEIVNDKDIGEIKQSASMLITDFSSMCFDFMFKNKPIAFYRIDANDPLLQIANESLINNNNVESKNSELYNIAYKADDVIDIVERYCKNNFELEEQYKKINDGFFAYRQDIRKHIIENILSSPENIPNGCPLEPKEFINYNTGYNCKEIVPFAFDGLYLSSQNGRVIYNKNPKIYFKVKDKKKAVINIELETTFNKKFKWQELIISVNDNLPINYKIENKLSILNIPIDMCDEIQNISIVLKNRKNFNMSVKKIMLEEVK